MRRMLGFLLFIILFPVQILAGVGDVDNRYYVTDEMWAQEPYKKFVWLKIGFDKKDYSLGEEGLVGSCTAQYIAPNLILSAGHCIYTMNKYVKDIYYFDEYIPSMYHAKYYAKLHYERVYKAENYKHELFDLKLIDTVYDGSTVAPGDWAIWLVTDPKYYSDAYFDMKEPTKTTDVINAGWGFARIIKDEEIDVFREIITNLRQLPNQEKMSISALSTQINEQCKEKGIAPFEERTYTLKASECKIVFEDCSDMNSHLYDGLKEIENASQKQQKKWIESVKKKEQKFKEICNNQKWLKKNNYPYMLATTCDTWQGNSGGGYISNNGKYIYGIVSGGYSSFDNENTNYATSAKQFKDKISELIKTYDSKNSVEDNVAKIPEKLYGDEYIEKTEQKESSESGLSINTSIATTEELEQILKKILSKKDLTEDDVLQFVDVVAAYQTRQRRLEQLQRKYEEAKATEQSLANRTLTALTVAATGIGGMELARGLAEQQADKEADQNMTAYIETMRCTYGDGKQVKAGPDEIELPGGNDSELMSLRNEYFALAKDLKERKEALGMKAGIESEEILDKSQTGLYDDDNIGINSGAYESLYRAKMLESETDQTKINEQQTASKNRVIGGGTAAGVGVVGGIIGNAVINNKNNDK